MLKMDFLRLLWLGASLSLTCPTTAQPLTVLRVPHIADAEPFIILNKQQQPVGGVLFELYHLLSSALQVPLQIEPVPRKMVTQILLKGEVDVYCNATPEWFDDPELRWSPPLFVHHDMVVSRQRYNDFVDFTQHAIGPIGTTYDYVYPTLKHLFTMGQLQRADSFSPRESLRLLQSGHLDLVVVSELEMHYFLRQGEQFFSLSVESNEIQCMYAPQLSEQQVKLLDDKINQLVRSGEINALLSKYQ